MHSKEQGQWCRDMGLSQRALRKAAAILTQLRSHVPALQKHVASEATGGPGSPHWILHGSVPAWLLCSGILAGLQIVQQCLEHDSTLMHDSLHPEWCPAALQCPACPKA